jgi:predicted  nucleic acid-binding Zn-ribbon protein
MPGPAATLREIHRLRRHARDLQDRIEQAPRQLRAQQSRVSREEDALREGQETIKRLKVATHEKEVSLKAVRSQIKKYEQQLNEATAKKEYDSLKAEIAAAEGKVRKLEDEILEVMVEVEDRTARLPDLEKSVQQAKADLARFEGEMQERVGRLEQQRQQALAEIAAVEAALPPGDVRNQYERLIKARGEDALAAVQGNICTACYTEITAQQTQDLRQGQFVVCKNCDRILYLPE